MRRSSGSTGALATMPASSTPFVSDAATVTATFTPNGGQSAAGRDVTFQVYRRSGLSGPAYLRVENEVVQTDASGVARYTYRGGCSRRTSSSRAWLRRTRACRTPRPGSSPTTRGRPRTCERGVADVGRRWTGGSARDPAEWKSLWDGQTFAGWDHAGSGAFERVIDDGAPALQAKGSGGILWYNAREFADYELEVAYEHNGVGDNGGIFLRFPNPGEDRAVANQGYQVAILDRVDDVAQRTGSVLGFATAQKLNAKPVGEGYNRFRIRFVGKRIEVYLNDDAQANADPVAVYDNADRATQGFVGIENNGRRSATRTSGSASSRRRPAAAWCG